MSAEYRVILTEQAKRDAKKLPHEIWRRFDETLTDISQRKDPRSGLKRLKGSTSHPFYSLRIGQYRAILNIFDDRLTILVLQMKPRTTVYRSY